MTRIVVAPDSFKGSLSSRQAASIIAEAIAEAMPATDIVRCPLADGGEGTREILSPFMPEHVCLIDSAELIGLNLPSMTSLDVMERGSAPLGEAILAGLNAGKRDFVIGLGGSATNDCGLGMLMALGLIAFDVDGNPVTPNLKGLLSVQSIDMSGLDLRLAESCLTVLSDVVSPLTGKNGATAVYGPQKGVANEEVFRIDAATCRFAQLCGKPELMDAAGAGAAGGLGFATMLLGGTIVSGTDYVMEKTGVHEKLVGADWVITGEGRSDAQTLQGKLPIRVARAARARGAKAALVSGSLDRAALPELEKEFDDVVGLLPDGMSVDEAMRQAGTLLAETVRQRIVQIVHGY